jgi:hypothetical protein
VAVIVTRLTYIERRALALRFADSFAGWDCLRLPSPDRHVGRVLMTRKYGFKSGFYPVGSREYGMIATSARSFQKAQTGRLPK